MDADEQADDFEPCADGAAIAAALEKLVSRRVAVVIGCGYGIYSVGAMSGVLTGPEAVPTLEVPASLSESPRIVACFNVGDAGTLHVLEDMAGYVHDGRHVGRHVHIRTGSGSTTLGVLVEEREASS
jgi:hypothetical protein